MNQQSATAALSLKTAAALFTALLIIGAAMPAAIARDYGNKYGAKTHKAGSFDYYSLVLSWSPSYCEAGGSERRDPQCTTTRPYGFVLHGLWPQYDKGWPEYCPVSKNSWVSNELINSMLDIMPSKKLIIHEYKKHGTCTGYGPENYYKASRTLYNLVKIPPRYLQPEKPLYLSPKEIENDFLVANPTMKPEMISIVCGKRRLREVRICFTKKGHLTSCRANEVQKRLCALPKVYLPPMRSVKKQVY